MFKIFNKIDKQELFFEEAVLDDLAQDFESLEQPLPPSSFKLISALAATVIIIVLGRLFFLGTWQNDFYSHRALINAGEITIVSAERGIIFDKFNKPLVKNIPDFRLNLKLVELLKDENEKNKIIAVIQEALNLPPDHINNLLKDVNLEKQNSIMVADNLNVEQIIKIKDLDLKAVQIEDNFKRVSDDPEAFSHIIGYTGFPTKKEAENLSSLNNVVGKSGLEAYYDNDLRGKNGEIINYRNNKGEIIDSKLSQKAVAGNQLYSTIDADLQSYFYQRLGQGIATVGSKSGAGIAINPQTGEVLALISFPGFNSNKITSELINDPQKPFFNRAISGVYSPGSTIKPLVAYAALKEGVINTQKEIYSAGYIEIPNPYFPDKPSRFLDWKANGWVNVYSAIARSCNIYFYAVGGGYGDVNGLGIERLKQYWRKFNLDKKTGIDLVMENQGSLPDPETKEKNTNDIWRLGDTYNVSIGQGDLMITPIELIDYIATIANGGKIYQPFIIKKIVAEDGIVIKENQSKVVSDYSSDIQYIKEVQHGMMDGVSKSYGTGYMLHDLPMTAASKTGTVQIENNAKINTFFVGFAPAENPQIAILVLVENSREGSLNTVPIAKDVLAWYYNNRLK